MHFLRRNLIFPCSPSAAVSLKSPRTEALLKGPHLAQEAASADCLQASILAAWEEEHTQAIWGGEGIDLWSQSQLLASRTHFSVETRLNTKSRPWPCAQRAPPTSQMLGIWSHSGSVV